MTNAAETLAQALVDIEHATLMIAGAPVEVVTVDGRDKLSELFAFEVTCDVPNTSPPPQDLIGQPASLVFHDGFGVLRPMHGIIAEAHRNLTDQGTAQLRVVVRPEVFLLTLGRDSRVFQDMTVPAIISQVMSERSRAKFRMNLKGSYRERVYTAQYREDDWAFLSRLCEEDGIYYWFEHGEQTTVVFSDDSCSAPSIVGPPLVDYRLDTGMLGNREMIHEMGSRCHATPTKFTVGSFDEQRPMLKVMATEGDGIHEMYDAPGGGPEDPAHVAHQARVRNEGAKAARHGIDGSTSSVRLVPGQTMVVAGHPRLDGEYLITEARYEVRQRRHFDDAGHGGYQAWFLGIPKDVPFRAPEDTPVTKQAGVQSGRVVGPPGEEIHTDGRGRVRVQLHWDREGGWDDQAGKWMRVAQRGTNNSMLLPRIGWNVTTFMLEGSVDAPQVLNRVHDAEHPPTYKLPDNKTRTVFKTLTSPADGSSNEIHFEDLAGAQMFFMNASKDMNYKVLNNRDDVVSHDQERVVGANQTVDIGNWCEQRVVNNQTWNIGANEELTIDIDRSKNVMGNETANITGDRKVKCGEIFSVAVTEDRTMTITGNVNEECEGNIAVAGCKTVFDITGSLTKKTEAQMTEDCGSVHTIDITGSKIEICGTDRALSINKTYDETIGGSLLMQTDDRFMDGSDEETFWDVKGPIIGIAPHIHMEAQYEIVLKVGGSSLTINETSVTIKADAYFLDGPELEADSKLITQN